MRTLLIMRHAKSDWGAGVEEDHQRPLAPRGVKAAGRMGRFLTAVDHAPELVISSTAVRALTTARLAAEAGGWACPVQSTDLFYGSGTEAVRQAIAAVPDSVSRLLVVGHEPTWSALVGVYSGGGSVCFPTAAVACVELAGGWARAGHGQLQWLVTPKLLKQAQA